MAAKRKKPAAKPKAKPVVAKAAPARARGKDDLVANFIAFAQKNPAVAVAGVLVVLVALVLLFK